MSYDFDSWCGEDRCCCGKPCAPGSYECVPCLHGEPTAPYQPPSKVLFDPEHSPAVRRAREVADRYRAELWSRAEAEKRARES